MQPLEVFNQYVCRALAVSHASDMRGNDHLWMRPEWMSGGERFRCCYINEGGGKLAAIERCKKRVVIRLRPATDQNYACPCGQAGQKLGIDQAFRLCRER